MSRLLVVVDVQKAMVTGQWAVANAEDFLAKWGARIEEAREEGTPVLFVQNDGEEPWDDAPGHPGWELFFTPRGEERTVRKTTLNVFESNPELAGEIKAQGFDELEMIGLQSELCVFESSKGALAHGFKVILPTGMHATMDTEEAKGSTISAGIQAQLEELGATGN
ncbi:MAG: isochorismatase family protein [Rhodoluna sp.]|nr:isochorismatase family protein [Rhodoluna sp.]